MKQYRQVLWLAAAVFALCSLPARAEQLVPTEPEIPIAVEERYIQPQTPAFDPANYDVTVTRTGRALSVNLAAKERQDQYALTRGNNPTLEIYKGDLLLASDKFAFG